VIRYLERNDIDDRKWNACIDRAFNGNLYGYAWFLDIVAGEWAALEENDYESVFPLVHRRKFGINYIYQPFFTQQLGLYSCTRIGAEALGKFIRSIPSKYRWIEINLNAHNNADEKEFTLVPQLNHELDLIHGYDKIRQGYSENLARNIRKAGKAGLFISKNVKPEDIIGLFRKNRGKEIRHLHGDDYRRLRQIAYTCLQKRMASITGVYGPQNQLCAGAFFIRSHNKSVFFFSGLDDTGRQAGAMPFLIDSFIREHSGLQLTFDFDGSNDPNLARFYKSFGSKELIYRRLMISRLPFLLNTGARIYSRLKHTSLP
jgi:hypothetical protein